jgi:hypothetical protein
MLALISKENILKSVRDKFHTNRVKSAALVLPVFDVHITQEATLLRLILLPGSLHLAVQYEIWTSNIWKYTERTTNRRASTTHSLRAISTSNLSL